MNWQVTDDPGSNRISKGVVLLIVLKLIVGNLIVIGLRFALFVSPSTNAIMGAAPKAFYGVASAILETMRQVGMVFSMGVAMLMFALHTGSVQITPDKYPTFQESMRASFIIFAILCLAGILASLAGGKVRGRSPTVPLHRW